MKWNSIFFIPSIRQFIFQMYIMMVEGEAKMMAKHCIKCELHGYYEEYDNGHKTYCLHRMCKCTFCQDHDRMLVLLGRPGNNSQLSGIPGFDSEIFCESAVHTTLDTASNIHKNAVQAGAELCQAQHSLS